jgi:hypothetical protein
LDEDSASFATRNQGCAYTNHEDADGGHGKKSSSCPGGS